MIRNRRAVFPKQMNGKKVPQQVLVTMLDLANWAPTHKRTEPWRFKVYTDNALVKLLDLTKVCYVKETPADKFNSVKLDKIEQRKTQVSHVIAICMKRDESQNPLPEFEEIASTSMAVQNMWLYLESTQKYGGYWSTPKYALGDDFRGFLGLQDEEKCLGLFYLGTIEAGLVKSEGKRGNWRDKVVFHS